MAKKAKEVPVKHQKNKLKRTHKITLLLNDKESEAVEAYCKKYRIKNRSKFVRETVMRSVMNRFLEDYPTLFEKQDLDRLVVTPNSHKHDFLQ